MLVITVSTHFGNRIAAYNFPLALCYSLRIKVSGSAWRFHVALAGIGQAHLNPLAGFFVPDHADLDTAPRSINLPDEL
jgi:hypothetical protein